MKKKKKNIKFVKRSIFFIFLSLVTRDRFSFSLLFDTHCSKCIFFRFVVFNTHIQMHQNASSESYSLHCRFLCCRKIHIHFSPLFDFVYQLCTTIAYHIVWIVYFVYLLFSLSTFVICFLHNSIQFTALHIILFCFVSFEFRVLCLLFRYEAIQ